MEEKFYKHHSPTGAVVLIFIGILFLLNNFGILPFGVWSVLWRFWPIIIILIGIKILLGRGKNHEAFTVISLILILLVLAVSIATVNPQMRSWMEKNIPWFPINQMMSNENQGGLPIPMYQQRGMFPGPGGSGGAPGGDGSGNYFYQQTPDNNFNY